MSEESRTNERGGGVTLGEFLEVLARRRRGITGIVLAALGLSLVVFAARPPAYRATATLLLDENGQAGGVLGELAMLTSAPTAVSEIEILRSRTIAEEAIRPRSEADAAEEDRHLGLRTKIDDEALRPLAALFAEEDPDPDAPRPRVRAELDWVDRSRDPSRLRVEFLAPDRVRVGPAGFAGLRLAASLFGADPIETVWAPGEPIEYGGMRLRLATEGDPTGHSYVVEWLSRVDAIERVLDGTRAAETRRNSGVIRLSFEDTDPRRAAETANALCLNYLDHNRGRSERRASQTVGFIEDQLASQLELLNQAELEVVRFQTENPESIDVDKTAGALIERISELEVERVKTKLMQVTLREALALLDSGDFEALSRLGADLADPISLSYIQEIALLQTESELLDRDDAGAYKGLVQARLLDVESSAQELALAIGELEGALAAIDAGDPNAYGRAIGAGGAAGDPLAQTYVEELAELRARDSELASDFTPEHPGRVAARAGIADVEARIRGHVAARLEGAKARHAEELARIDEYRARLAGMPQRERGRIEAALATLRRRTYDHLGSRLAGLDRARTSLEDEIASIEAELGELPEEQREVADPMRRLEAHTEIVKFLLGRQQEAEITRAATVASADFIDRAVAPRERHAPSLGLHLFGGLALGLLVALALAFALESLDQGVFTASELEDATGLSVFGAIPDFARGKYRVKGDRARFLAMRDDPEGPVAEAYRSLRANLKFAVGQGTDVHTFAFTSSTQGEGKSVTNIDTSMAFAMGGQRVLLVDADMRRPTVDGHLGLPRSPGLSEVLTEGLDWREHVHRDVLENLDVLTAGHQPARPGDLLGGEACRALVAELREAYDLVVFDVPPVLAVADIGGFASSLDATMLLCRAEKLNKSVVTGAALRLRQANANLIGAVLNAARPQRRDEKYGHGYGYGYGYTSNDAA